ncbi:MAG: helix-turn-helix domain-containing protein [Acidobacteria bacterium]|nr:helix-turn-helix domain-containing protein [Acidobacteriota bacterium]
MKSSIQNQLRAVRQGRGLSASELAERVGVTRQTIYAIEAGSYMPNTEVTLRLARALEAPVEELFSLAVDEPSAPRALPADVLSAVPPAKGQAVRICQVGDRRVCIPVNAAPYYLPEADGVVARPGKKPMQADVVAFPGTDGSGRRLVLAGCDPAIGFVSHLVERSGGVEVVSAAAASQLALQWLHEGKVNIAGSHLEDAATGEFNLPYLRSEFPGEDFAVVSFARWEEGFVVAPGNPKGIRKAEDLTRRGVRLVNRETGSGSRGLLDRLLHAAGVPAGKVTGYDRLGYGHLAVAYLVLTGEADCCVATRSAARTFQLDFVPLQSERYDFVMRRPTLATPTAQVFIDVLQRAALRRKLEVLAGYDTAQTGAILA